MTQDMLNETVERPRRNEGLDESRTYLSILARATPIRNARRLGGILVMCLVIGCWCSTTPPVAAEGLQSLAHALDIGVVGGGGPGQGAPVCFRGEGTDRQQAYDVCLATTPDSVCEGGRWCVALPTAMLGHTSG
jgi:hypothetical protein